MDKVELVRQNEGILQRAHAAGEAPPAAEMTREERRQLIRDHGYSPDESLTEDNKSLAPITLTAMPHKGMGRNGKSLGFAKSFTFVYQSKDLPWYEAKSSAVVGLEPHFTGVVKDRRGRTICFREGKRVQYPRKPKDDPKERSKVPQNAPVDNNPAAPPQAQDKPRTPQEFGQEGFLIRHDTPVENAALECEWYVLEGVLRVYEFYSNPALAKLNSSLRGGVELTPSDISMQARLQRAFDMSPLATAEVYRGVDLTYSAELTQGLLDSANNSMATGEPMQLTGYTPCSTRSDAQFFSKIRMCLTVSNALLAGPDEAILNLDTFIKVNQVTETPYGWDIIGEEVVELDPESAVPALDPGQVQPADAPAPMAQEGKALDPHVQAGSRVRMRPTREYAEHNHGDGWADYLNDASNTTYATVLEDAPAPHWGYVTFRPDDSSQIGLAYPEEYDIDLHEAEFIPDEKALDPRVRVGSRVRTQPTQATAAAQNQMILDEYGAEPGDIPPTGAEFVVDNRRGGQTVTAINPGQHFDVDTTGYHPHFQQEVGASTPSSTYDVISEGDEAYPEEQPMPQPMPQPGNYSQPRASDALGGVATHNPIPREDPKSLYSARRKALRKKWLSDVRKMLT
jgi:hypothetical protein